MSRNLADRLHSADTTVIRLLRACGTPEDILRDGSDCDRFFALAAALSKAEGHPVAERLQREAQEATGLSAALCPHTAPSFWQAWTDRHWYRKEHPAIPALAAPCPHCSPVLPLTLRAADAASVPDPLTPPRSITDLAAYAAYLTACLSAAGGYARLSLPPACGFARPDPYHAALSLRAHAAGIATAHDRALLLAQSLRILGETAKQRKTTLLLLGGTPETVQALCAYLAACDRLPAMVWLPDDPADAAHVSGLYAEVRTGYTVTADTSPSDIARIRAAYARVAPIGCVVELSI